jgi:hypothetical protein
MCYPYLFPWVRLLSACLFSPFSSHATAELLPSIRSRYRIRERPAAFRSVSRLAQKIWASTLARIQLPTVISMAAFQGTRRVTPFVSPARCRPATPTPNLANRASGFGSPPIDDLVGYGLISAGNNEPGWQRSHIKQLLPPFFCPLSGFL